MWRRRHVLLAAGDDRLATRVRRRQPGALRLLAVVAVLVDELRDLLQQAVVLLHEQLVHGCQLPVQRLQPR
uniref:Uncharacterized protein n=1 Tax=Arundo donax TaxID=35708 RepID=A0A0A9D7E8_ARUDO